MTQIDLNSDMGEGFGRWSLGDDEAMLSIVTSANIACGFHAGDPLSISATVAAAHARGVAIGAHVAYRDLAGFGRRYLDVSPEELTGDVIYQLGALKGIAASIGAQVRYVKPHGALYNTIAHDEAHARAVIEAITRVDDSLVYMGLAGAPILGWAREAGLRTVAEAFADRGYRPDGQLVSRREHGAVLHDEELVAARMVQLATQGTIEAVDGSTIELEADSICVHSDTPGAVNVAHALTAALRDAEVTIRPFVSEAG